MEKKILDALTEKYTGVKESILRRVATKLAKTVENEDDITTAVEGAFTDVLEAYGDQRATDAQKTAVANYERKHGLKDGKAINGGEPDENEPDENGNNHDEEPPAWAKKLLEENKSLKQRLDQMDGERITTSRKAIIDKLIEPLPDSLRKAYSRQRLDDMSDDDFASLQEEIKGEVEDISGQLSAKGAVFNRPPKGGGQQTTSNVTDKEVNEVVDKLHF